MGVLMPSKGREVVSVQISDPEQAHRIIQEFLAAHEFKAEGLSRRGEQVYSRCDAMMKLVAWPAPSRVWRFSYSIQGNTAVINAWFGSTLGIDKREWRMDCSTDLDADQYRDILAELFAALEQTTPISKVNGENIMNNGNNQQPINNGNNQQSMNFDPQTGQPLNQNYNSQPSFSQGANMGQPQMQNGYQQPMAYGASPASQNFRDSSTKNKETMCEVGFWLSIVTLIASPFILPFLFVFLDFYFAAQGLKTRKRGKAIATIVMSVLAIVVWGMSWVLAIMLETV